MKKIISLAVKRPRSVIALLLVITAVLAGGMKRLRMEPSTEALMPRQVDEYRYNMRMKKVFGDSKLFLLTLVEENASQVFSKESFVQLNEIVEEIEEFHEFNYEDENKRLETLLELGNVTYYEEKATGKQDEELMSEDEIDSLLAGETAIESEYFDVFDIEAPLPDDIVVNPSRAKRDYDFSQYTDVTRNKLEAVLDNTGRRQLETVLFRTGLDNVSNGYEFSQKEYGMLVEEFEQAYLFKSMEAVKNFMNPISGEDIVGTSDSLIPVDLVEIDDNGHRLLPESEEDFEKYRLKLKANPLFENNVYSVNGAGEITALAMNIQLQVMEKPDLLNRYLTDVFYKYNAKDEALVYTPVGVPVFEQFIQDYMKRDMKTFMPFVLLVIIATFLLNFRMVRGVVLPTVAVLLSIIWTMGLMGYLGIPLTMVVNILPTILMAVGSSYSIHIFNQYLHDIEDIKASGKSKGLIRSMTRISVTVLLAAITTFIGFSTLGFNQVVSLKHFGIFSAVGTLFAMLIASVLIPAVLSLTKLPKKKSEASPNNALLLRLLEFGGRRAVGSPLLVILITAAILALSFFGLSRLSIESSPVSQFKDNSYVVQADTKVSQALDGSITFNLLIDTGEEGGAKNPEFLRRIDELAAWMVSGENRSSYNFLTAYTFADVAKRMNKAMNEDDDAYYTVPDSKAAVEDYIMLYSGEDRDSDGLVDTMERFVDPHYRVANVFIKTGSYNGKMYSTGTLLDGIAALKNKLQSDSYFSRFNYTVAGQTLNYAVLNRLIARGQILTILLTLLIIAGIIYLLFRDIKAALVSLIPISCSIIVVFGTMGFLDIPLDIAKSIIAAITIGIGIDDTIHMLKTIRQNRMLGYSAKDAILHSYKEAGMAIVYTSLALIFGFAVLMLSEFKVLFYFGWLVAMNMITTTVAALLVLPAAVFLFKVNFNLKDEKENIKATNAVSILDNISIEGE